MQTFDSNSSSPSHPVCSPSAADSVTPMMAQYIEIKTANPDSLLFYRMGDFYELFFDDAVQAAHVLGIALTRRGKHQGQDVPMCGVPIHAADDYLQKLISAGFRVAVCEQLEDPAEARKRGGKSIVRRDVVRLVTPGTLTEDTLLDPTRHNYLAALTWNTAPSAQGALAWVDISTGAFFVCSLSPPQILEKLAQIDPRELLYSEEFSSSPLLKKIKNETQISLTLSPSLTPETAQDWLMSIFGEKHTSALTLLSVAESVACASLLAYIDITQRGAWPALDPPSKTHTQTTLLIDPATRTNLELFWSQDRERRGSVFWAINRTVTAPGARLLAERLAAPLTCPEAIIARLDSVSSFLQHTSLRTALREKLRKGPDMVRALARLSLGRGSPRDLKILGVGLEVAQKVTTLLAFQFESDDSEIAEALCKLKAIPSDLQATLARALKEELPLLKRDGGFIAKGYNAALDACLQLRDESHQVMAKLQARYSAETQVKALKIKHNNVLGWFIEVPAQQGKKLQEISGTEPFFHRQTTANAMRFTTDTLVALERQITDASARALTLELEIFDELQNRVCVLQEELKAAAQALSVLDVSAALAYLAVEYAYTRPKLDSSLSFAVEGGRHVVVEQILRSTGASKFLPNSCQLGPHQIDTYGHIWLVTGPNMAGKSTFLRQNALIVLLAQMGSYVPAEAAHLGVVDQLFSRVGAADNLVRGQSTFMVEMCETAAILTHATARSFVILDEIGRGTATYDGLSIAWATIEHLHQNIRCRALFATHYHEMTALADQLERLETVTVQVKEWKGELVFLHKIVPGTADRSYGVQVAKKAGLPPSVIQRAEAILVQLEQQERLTQAPLLISEDLPLCSQAKATDALPLEEKQKGADNGFVLTPALIALLQDLDPDRLTPREAHTHLYKLKELWGEVDSRQSTTGKEAG